MADILFNYSKGDRKQRLVDKWLSATEDHYCTNKKCKKCEYDGESKESTWY